MFFQPELFRSVLSRLLQHLSDLLGRDSGRHPSLLGLEVFGQALGRQRKRPDGGDAAGDPGGPDFAALPGDMIYRPVAMVRKPDQAAQFEDEGIATVFGDLAGDLANTPAGVGKVIFDLLREYLLAKQAADNHLKASGPARWSINIADHMVELGDISRKDVAAALVASLPNTAARNRLYVIWNGDTPIKQALASLA